MSSKSGEAVSKSPFPQLPDQEVLPFPPTPSASIAGRTMQDSIYRQRSRPKRLPDDAPNILIILIDDAGPALPAALGGEVHTPTLERVLKTGLGYNCFHTTAMCSPTRAALLTGRNHHHVSAGQIAEFANDWDGYAGVQPKSAAMVPEVLKSYGYSTAAFGKWHNTPMNETTAAGPFDNWPTGYGFEHFYGFLGGEASQYEPSLVRNTTLVEPPKTPEEGYHLSEDLADDAIDWVRKHKSFQPDKPFFMYWATGAVHGPHHIFKEWADKYKGRFDDGWDAYRERAFERAKAKGWIPADTQLTPRHPLMDSWESIPENEKPFQRRLMEIFAGFAEHADTQAGRVLDEIERLGYGDNTLVFYIWGDNGSSAEGQGGTISELLAQNGIPSTIEQHLAALDGLGGMDVLGSPKTDNMYHAGWAWAGSAPYQHMKLIASHFGGTRNPMAVCWPAKIAHDPTPRAQFHHVNDIVPTIYEVTGIRPPRVVNGLPQDPIDGVSIAYTFADAVAKGQKLTQYFEIQGSRGIYHDGWFASAFGPRIPWQRGMVNLADWTPDNDKWELYDLTKDWSQANDLAAAMPEKLARMKELFAIEFARNNGYPVGGSLYVFVHPDQMLFSPYTEWTFSGNMTRMPEATAPRLGNTPNVVTIEANVPADANGVLYSLGGFSGGLSCYVVDGIISYEYNLFEVARTHIRATGKLPAGKATIAVKTAYAGAAAPGAPLKVTVSVNGAVVAEGNVSISAPVGFTANGCLNIGSNPGSPVSVDYYDRAPFAFNGTIDRVHIKYV